jgi:hypothetical protein
MCIRCGSAEAPGRFEYCPSCSLAARLEVAGGLRRLGRYLAAWAAFELWLRERPECEAS